MSRAFVQLLSFLLAPSFILRAFFIKLSELKILSLIGFDFRGFVSWTRDFSNNGCILHLVHKIHLHHRMLEEKCSKELKERNREILNVKPLVVAFMPYLEQKPQFWKYFENNCNGIEYCRSEKPRRPRFQPGMEQGKGQNISSLWSIGFLDHISLL